MTDAPLKCHGSEDEQGAPICEGDDVRRVTVTTPVGWTEPAVTFSTEWCRECRYLAARTFHYNVQAQV